MKLLYLKLTHYRVHRDLTVEFDPQMNFITGINESGKSTIADAIYQVLFLRHRGDSEKHKEMQSEWDAGTPRVTLGFSIDGNEYEITKSFTRNAKASARLALKNGPTWQNDEAEARLATLVAAHGQGLLNTLFVRQGTAAEDPTRSFQRIPELTQRLRDLGGATIISTGKDDRTAQLARDAYDRNVVQKQRPKVGGEWKAALEQSESASREFLNAQAFFESLLSAEASYQQAKETIAEQQPLLSRCREELADTESKLQQVRELRLVLEQKQSLLETAQLRHGMLVQEYETLRHLATKIGELEQQRKPKLADLERLEATARDANRHLTNARLAVEEAEERWRRCRWELDHVESCRERLGLDVQLTKLLQDQAAATAEQRKKFELENQLVRLAEVTDAKLQELEIAERHAAMAKARFQAMGARVSVMDAAQPVLVDGRSLTRGEEVSITADTELTYGDDLKLRIVPGTHGELALAAEELQAAEQAFQQQLETLAVRSLHEAREVNTQRRGLETEIRWAATALQRFQVDQLPAEIENMRLEITRLEQRLCKLRGQLPEISEPATSDAATEQAAVIRIRLEQAESIANLKRGEREAAETAAIAASESHATLREETQNLHFDLTNLERQRAALEARGGEAERREAIDQALLEKQQAHDSFDGVQSELVRCQPELLERRKTRLKDAIQDYEHSLEDAKEALNYQKGHLQRHVNVDPEGELKQKQFEMEKAAKRLRGIDLQVRAWKKIIELYDELKQHVAQAYGRQLGEKIKEYLQQLYGTDAQVQLEMRNNQFERICLSRPGFGSVSFGFETLSGGTKEQVGAAARLAIAELMSTGTDKSLPVVLDDSFANTDEIRITTVKDMLTLAKERGVQVIVLSCNRTDFSGLGGKVIRLNNPAHASWFASPMTPRMPAANVRIAGCEPTNEQPPCSTSILPTTDEGASCSDDEVDSSTHDHTAGWTAAVTQEQRNRFLKALRGVGGSAQNSKLRSSLGWEPAVYTAVKKDLVARQEVKPGKGPGGSVSIPS